MKHFFLNILSAAIGQALVFMIYQGFVQSYAGRNAREELTRVFNQLFAIFKKRQK